jgi:hypothetical protein
VNAVILLCCLVALGSPRLAVALCAPVAPKGCRADTPRRPGAGPLGVSPGCIEVTTKPRTKPLPNCNEPATKGHPTSLPVADTQGQWRTMSDSQVSGKGEMTRAPAKKSCKRGGAGHPRLDAPQLCATGAGKKGTSPGAVRDCDSPHCQDRPTVAHTPPATARKHGHEGAKVCPPGVPLPG